MKDEEMAEEYKEKHICNTCCADRQDCGNDCTFSRCGVQGFLAGLKAGRQNEKVEYTLKKIIETVQNDNIDEYGARLVLIKDFANECLQVLI